MMDIRNETAIVFEGRTEDARATVKVWFSQFDAKISELGLSGKFTWQDHSGGYLLFYACGYGDGEDDFEWIEGTPQVQFLYDLMESFIRTFNQLATGKENDKYNYEFIRYTDDNASDCIARAGLRRFTRIGLRRHIEFKHPNARKYDRFTDFNEF